jgi:hypothetical protein
MANKYVRALPYTTGNPSNENAFILKFMYEFWGYCVNGGTSLNTPGGFPTVTYTGGGLSVNLIEGTSVLASGSDGSTILGGATGSGAATFTSASATFTSALVNKYITTWIPGSGSSEDSIYRITAVPNANTLIINANNGGTPHPVSQHPIFTARTGIRYRVFDPVIAATGAGNGNFLVFQFDPTAFNTNANLSQVQVILRPGYGNTNYGLILSPSGSWNGSSFLGSPSTTLNGIQSLPTATLTVNSTQGFPGAGTLLVGTQIVTYTGITSTTFTGCAGGTGSQASGTTVKMSTLNDTSTEINPTENGGGFWNNAGGNAVGFVTMIGDKDFFMMHVKSTNQIGGGGSIMHIECPYRLYTSGQDPNPFTGMISGVAGLYTNGGGSNYGGGFRMTGTDNSTRTAYTLVKCLAGDANNFNYGLVPGQSLTDPFLGFNVFNGTVVSSEALLAFTGDPTQWNMARAKLKNVRFSGPFMPAYHRIGNNGQFIHLTNGICWPWDNTILPFNLMPQGF